MLLSQRGVIGAYNEVSEFPRELRAVRGKTEVDLGEKMAVDPNGLTTLTLQALRGTAADLSGS